MDLSRLQAVKVLSTDPHRHLLHLACSVPDSEKLAIVQVVAATPTQDALKQIESVEEREDNKYRLRLKGGGVSVTVVHPGTKQLYLKYLATTDYFLEETPEHYRTVMKPYVDSLQPAALQWVYNILDHVSETEDIFYEDDDITLLPDLKFKSFSAESYYFTGVFRRRDLTSLRDLRGTHLPMLRRVEERVLEVLTVRLGVSARSVQLYFHYLPSFYHLHLHVTNLNFSNELPRAHPLPQVLMNLDADSEYYACATLTLVLNANHVSFPKIAADYGISVPPILEEDLSRLG
jgi:m7GpppX diphosphatase